LRPMTLFGALRGSMERGVKKKKGGIVGRGTHKNFLPNEMSPKEENRERSSENNQSTNKGSNYGNRKEGRPSARRDKQKRLRGCFQRNFRGPHLS